MKETLPNGNGADRKSGNEIVGKDPTTLTRMFTTINNHDHVSGIADIIDDYLVTSNVSKKSLLNLRETATNRYNRLMTSYSDLQTHYTIAETSSEVGRTMLILSQDPSLESKSFSQLWDVFNACMFFSQREVKHSDDIISKNIGESFIEPYLKKELRKMNSKNILDTLNAGNPPAWFDGNKKTWGLFIWSIYLKSCIYQYQYDPETKNTDMRKVSRKNVQIPNIWNFTNADCLPDWIEHAQKGEIVTLQDISQEYEEDILESARIKQQIEQNERQRYEIELKYSSKANKAFEHFNQKAVDIHHLNYTSDFNSFYTDLQLIYLHKKGYQKLHDYDLITSQMYNERIKSVKQTFEKIFPLYRVNQDFLALWIEKQLIKTRLIESSQDSASQVYPYLTHFINKTLTKRENQNLSLENNLKSDNKKTYRILDNTIAPLFELFTNENLNDLKETLDLYKDSSIEDVIWYITNITHSHKDDTFPNRTEQLFKEICKYSSDWFIHHSEWVYCNIRQNAEKFSSATQAPQIANHISEEHHKVEEEIQELEQETTQIKLGNLNGWDIKYLTQHKSDGESLSIIGTTLDEITETMDKFMRDEGIKVPIPASSIINTVEWTAGIPAEIFDTWMAEEQNGEIWKKIKRGGMRLFCQRDIEKKQLLFYVIPRKEWHRYVN